MRITPLDVRNHPFRKRLSGYDRDEVDAFLQMVAEDYEDLVRESAGFREQVIKLEVRVQDLSANETVLKDTLTTAQKLSEDLKRTAVKEAEVIVGEAEIKGEKVLAAAHRRAAKLAEEIREMKSLRSRLSEKVRATIETHMSLLEGLSAAEHDDPVADAKVSYLTRPPREVQSGGEG
jgi:cell division initiation protein